MIQIVKLPRLAYCECGTCSGELTSLDKKEFKEMRQFLNEVCPECRRNK